MTISTTPPAQLDAGSRGSARSAFRTIEPVRVGLVGCVKTKLDHAAPAEDLYVSPLFRGRRAFVALTCDRWFVLSAMHGLVSPAEVLDPYEETLNGQSTATKRTWATSVLEQLDRTGLDYADSIFEIHAGAEYRNFGLADGLRDRGAAVEVPVAHLAQGEQLAFYSRTREAAAASPPSGTQTGSSPQAARSSYAPLGDYLQAAGTSLVELAFAQIERVLSRSLPPSASRHRAWWSNESSGTHSHAAAWMGVGWRVAGVDFASRVVRFRRTAG